MPRKSAFVKKVIDGDTFELDKKVRGTNRVRIANVDTPEKGKPGSKQATEFTKRQIEKKRVVLDVKAKDQYGRLLANVYDQQGKSLGKKLRRKGW